MLPIPLVVGLGITQIVSWGSLFYAIGVLGPAMRRDLGVSELYLFGSFTAGLMISGALSPAVGRLIDAKGGRLTLSAGSGMAAGAMALLALAPNAETLVAGWLVAGAAMAACLYDPAFATLSQHSGTRYRNAVTAVTLFGGFASTVFWPLSHLLLEAWGWRATLWIYAAMHLLICLPIHRLLVPAWTGLPHDTNAPVASAGQAGSSGPKFRYLTLSLALATFVFGVIAVHLITLLTAAGLTAAQAVTISMLVGPMQVAGRVAELGLSSRVRAVTVGVVAFAMLFVSLIALISVEGFGIAAIVFVVAYGFGNGVLTIVRGAAPAEMFGREALGTLLGKLARACFFAKSIAPAALPGMLAVGMTNGSALAGLAVVSLAGMGSYALAVRAKA